MTQKNNAELALTHAALQELNIPSASSYNNKQIDNGVIGAGSFNLSMIFTLFVGNTLHLFLETVGKFFLFPIAAIEHIVRAGLAWRQAYLDGWKKESVINALLETVGALAITTAVVGALAALPGFVMAAPIIFAAVTGTKSLYTAGLAIRHLSKSFTETDPELKKQHRHQAAVLGVGALIQAVTTVAIATVMIFAHHALAGIGIAGGAAGLLFAGYKIWDTYFHQAKAKKPSAKKVPVATVDEPGNKHGLAPKHQLTNGAKIAQVLGAPNDSSTTLLTQVPSSLPTARPIPVSTAATKTTTLEFVKAARGQVTPVQKAEVPVAGQEPVRRMVRAR